MVRKKEDGLLLVAPARIYGKRVKNSVDSGATRCFITPSCIARVGLKGIPHDVFLELGTEKNSYPRVMCGIQPSEMVNMAPNISNER